GFPDDFRYVLGLQEAVVVGMADGFAQASGKTGFVNLHTAPGLGNAMGAIFNAQANHSPLVITAGQQARSLITLQANLTNRDATRMPHPLVKWSYEPPRAEDVPHAIARAIHAASLPPKGPAFVSIPMDDWAAEVDEDAVRHVAARSVTGVATAAEGSIVDIAAQLESARNPVMVAGPDIDAAGAWELAIELAEKQKLPVWASPAPGAGRLGFPENHPNFRGVLPPAIGPLGETLAPYDFVLVVGASVFAYYPNIPGPLLAQGTKLVAITSDPDEAQRAPMGDAVVADVRATLGALVDGVTESDREPPEPLPPPPVPEDSDPISPSAAVQALADAWPDDGIAVVESPSATLAVRNRLKLSKPGSWFFAAGGGLGFGLPAAVGVQLAEPSRPVVCVIGEGSVQYAVQAFWTARAYDVPLTVLVLRNEEYAILKWFAGLEQVTGAPGLDLPQLESAALAAAYGVNTRKTSGVDETREALRTAIASPQPELVEVRVSPGMALA
ncbi:MAG TPA: benzoylformate decarboxylase, partial [Thermoleophilaceae bacterium]